MQGEVHTAVHGQASSDDGMPRRTGWRMSVHVHTAIDIHHGVDGVGERTSGVGRLRGGLVQGSSGVEALKSIHAVQQPRGSRLVRTSTPTQHDMAYQRRRPYRPRCPTRKENGEESSGTSPKRATRFSIILPVALLLCSPRLRLKGPCRSGAGIADPHERLSAREFKFLQS